MNEENFFQSDQIKPADGELEILDLKAEPYPDQKRVKVTFRLSFFQSPPNASISLRAEGGQILTSVDLVNIISPENEITLHLPRSRRKAGIYQVELTLFELEEQETQPGEKGEVKLTTTQLSSLTIPVSLS